MAMTAATNAKAGLSRLSRGFAADYLGMCIALALLMAFFGTTTQHFFSARNLQAIANLVPAAVILATGMTLVLVIAEIDLSVGSVLGLCGAVLGTALTRWGWAMPWALMACLGTGLLCGAFNGLVSIKWRLPSFIVTLGMLEVARGGAHAISNSQTQYIGGATQWISDTRLLGLALPFYVAVVVVAVAQLALSRTVFGRYLIAIGTNQEAVRLSGIDPRPVKLGVFLVAGFLVSLAAIIDTSRFESADPNAGTGFELQAIAAAVIGGTSLMGGRGSVVCTFLGVLIIAVLNSGLASMGARDETKRIVTGLVIIAAVIVDYYRQRWSRLST